MNKILSYDQIFDDIGIIDIGNIVIHDELAGIFDGTCLSISEISIFSTELEYEKVIYYNIEFAEKLIRDFYMPTLERQSYTSSDVWKIGYLHDSREIYTQWGKKNGKIQNSRRKMKSVYSALVHIRELYLNKSREGYVGPGENILERPQLGVAYKKPTQDSQGNIPDDNFPVAVSPKLDGHRCIFFPKDNTLNSRENLRIFGFNDLEYQSSILSCYLGNYNIDGELYNHDLSLQEITSIVNRKKEYLKYREENNESIKDSIYYYVFDFMIDNIPYDQRFVMLKSAYDMYKLFCEENNIIMKLFIVSYDICSNRNYLDDYLQYYLSSGYEGIVIRHLSWNARRGNIDYRFYFRRRNKALIKYKPVYDEDCIIVDIFPGEGMFRNIPVFNMRRLDVTYLGNDIIFNCIMLGENAYREQILVDKNLYIGRIANVLYSSETDTYNFNHPRISVIRGEDFLV